MTDPLLNSLVDLARIPSAVPLGAETLIEPDDPMLVDYVQNRLRPKFIEAGALDIIDLPHNQFAVRFGTGEGPCLALVAYTPTQHHNLMAEPWSGRVATPLAEGIDEPCAFGQGITQNKVHQACLLSIARLLARSEEPLNGTLLLCVNNEGRSSHDCSLGMLSALPVRPDLLIQLFPTGFGVSVGNRGRADLRVHIAGSASHSSSPPPGGGVLAAATAVLSAVERLDERVRTTVDPELGAERIIPYQVVFDPLAPHTLPSSARLTFDRRLLPGTPPEAAVGQLRETVAALGDFGCDITVEHGVTMLPARFPSERADLLVPLDAAIERELGAPGEHTFYGGSFDAGGPLSLGVPTVMFGVPEEGDILGDDYVRLAHVRAQDRILRGTITNFFGAPTPA
ncbi:peptidase dimerization domain-containing protein [Saccharomonospora sp. NPDC006951]